MERSWNFFHHFTHAPQKAINVYGFVYGFGVAFMVSWGGVMFFFRGGGGAFMVSWGCVYGFGGGIYVFLGGVFMVLVGAFMV